MNTQSSNNVSSEAPLPTAATGANMGIVEQGTAFSNALKDAFVETGDKYTKNAFSRMSEYTKQKVDDAQNKLVVPVVNKVTELYDKNDKYLDNKIENAESPFIKVIFETIKKFNQLLGKIPNFCIKLAKFLYAIVVIVLILLLFYIIYYLIYNMYPQLGFICHWIGFDSYMEKHYSEMKQHFKTLIAFVEQSPTDVQSAYYSLGYNLPETIKGPILEHLKTFNECPDDMLVNVFKFWDSLQNPTGILSKMDLNLLPEEYLKDGEMDPENALLKELIEYASKMKAFRQTISSLKETINNSEFQKVDLDIVGCLDPIKLHWLKLLLEGNESKDETLNNMVDKFKGFSFDVNYWALHLNIEGCGIEPFTDNEKVFFEIMNYKNKCSNHGAAIQYINNVLEYKTDKDSNMEFPNIKPNSLEGTRQIMNSIMSVYDLDLKLNYYFYDIRVSYETRKAGYRLNFVVLTYYLWPWLQWVFIIKIGQQIWMPFGENFKKKFVGFLEWWATLPEFLAKLPLILGGEGFEQHDKVQDSRYVFLNFITNLVDKRDTVEHFGFLKGLLSIGKFFAGILQVAKALVFAITEPLKFLMMLIGFVIALAMMIVYILLTVTGISFVLAFIWAVLIVLVPALFFTIAWTLICIPMIAVYIILWLVDLLLGGLIMALFRCENTPDKWYSYSSYAFDNTYYRSLPCIYTCAERYKPDTIIFLSVCRRLDSITPSYCPQQNLFKIYKDEGVPEPKYFKDFEITMNLAKMSYDQRIKYLKDVRKLREEFNSKCKFCYSNDIRYDDSRSLVKDGWSYTHISKALCKYTWQLANDSDSTYDDICNICTTMYGGDIPMYSEKITFNTTEKATSDNFSNKKDGFFDNNNPYIKGLGAFLIVILSILIVMYLINILGNQEMKITK